MLCSGTRRRRREEDHYLVLELIDGERDGSAVVVEGRHRSCPEIPRH
jgi:hypothetical protein